MRLTMGSRKALERRRCSCDQWSDTHHPSSSRDCSPLPHLETIVRRQLLEEKEEPIAQSFEAADDFEAVWDLRDCDCGQLKC
jgi:hypothetical protein